MEPAREPLARMAAERLARAPTRPVFSNLDAAAHPADAGGHRPPPGRARREPGPVRRDDRGDARRGGEGLRRGRAGRRPHVAGRTRSSAIGRTWPSPATPAAGPGWPVCSRRWRSSWWPGCPCELEAADAGPIRDVARSRGTCPSGDGSAPPRPSTWMVNGSRADRWARPEPRRLGQASTPADPRGLTRDRSHQSTPSRGTVMSEPKPPTHRPTASAADPHIEAGRVDAPVRPPSGRSFARRLRTRPRGVPGDDAERSSKSSGRRCSPTSPAGSRCPRSRQHPMPGHPRRRNDGLRRNGLPTVPVVAATASSAVAFSCGGRGRLDRPIRPILRPRPAARRSPRTLLEIVRDRTGYPLEVLRLELDLEADLGIDSIKRVEILGKLRDAFPQIGSAADPKRWTAACRARRSGPSSIASSGRSASASATTSRSCTFEARAGHGNAKWQGPPRDPPAAPGGGRRPPPGPRAGLMPGRHGPDHRRRPRDRGIGWPR